MTEQITGAPVPPPPAAPVELPPAPTVIQVSPGAPQAEPGDQTTEWRLVKAACVAIGAGTALLDAVAGAGLYHVDPSVVVAGNGFSAALVSLITAAYAYGRSVRKAGTQG